jgi:hypothetical protein
MAKSGNEQVLCRACGQVDAATKGDAHIGIALALPVKVPSRTVRFLEAMPSTRAYVLISSSAHAPGMRRAGCFVPASRRADGVVAPSIGLVDVGPPTPDAVVDRRRNVVRIGRACLRVNSAEALRKAKAMPGVGDADIR